MPAPESPVERRGQHLTGCTEGPPQTLNFQRLTDQKAKENAASVLLQTSMVSFIALPLPLPLACPPLFILAHRGSAKRSSHLFRSQAWG